MMLDHPPSLPWDLMSQCSRPIVGWNIFVPHRAAMRKTLFSNCATSSRRRTVELCESAKASIPLDNESEHHREETSHARLSQKPGVLTGKPHQTRCSAPLLRSVSRENGPLPHYNRNETGEIKQIRFIAGLTELSDSRLIGLQLN